MTITKNVRASSHARRVACLFAGAVTAPQTRRTLRMCELERKIFRKRNTTAVTNLTKCRCFISNVSHLSSAHHLRLRRFCWFPHASLVELICFGVIVHDGTVAHFLLMLLRNRPVDLLDLCIRSLIVSCSLCTVADSCNFILCTKSSFSASALAGSQGDAGGCGASMPDGLKLSKTLMLCPSNIPKAKTTVNWNRPPRQPPIYSALGASVMLFRGMVAALLLINTCCLLTSQAMQRKLSVWVSWKICKTKSTSQRAKI